MYSARPNPAHTLRHQFTEDRLETASSTQIVGLCFERLDRDLAGALAAIEEQHHFATNEALGHAQDLLTELAGMLDLGAWEHAGSLMAVYDYVLRLLTHANVVKAAPLVNEARHLLGELAAAFAEAARSAASEYAATGTEGQGSAAGRWSARA